MIVGFNLPFDLSRLAVDWESSTKGGWSLILSQWRNPKTGQLQANKFFPRIVVNALNSKTAIIYSTRAPLSEPRKTGKRSKLWPVARFLDLRTLLWALYKILFAANGLRRISYSRQVGAQTNWSSLFGGN
jgi:hypothetical protein